MIVRFHPHALERIAERGATEDEVRAAVESGETFPAKFERVGFRRNFPFNGLWRGRSYPQNKSRFTLLKKNRRNGL